MTASHAMKKTALTLILSTLSCACLAGTATDNADPTRKALTTALKTFLAQRGDICLAKYDWPIDVSARDVVAKTRDAVQMPAMEQLGLVKASEGYVVYKTDDRPEEEVPTRRYELTERGRSFYKTRETVSHPHTGQNLAHHGDLCAGHLGLDSIVHVDVAEGSMPRANVSYLYSFAPEAWVKNEQIRQVFPMLDTLIKGQGKQAMTQRFHFDGKAWVADTELDQ
ncbi:MAG TPA: hypothetical protein VGM81_04855 [Burkholderiaceae bacterium]|jgi:hypothetical protein